MDTTFFEHPHRRYNPLTGEWMLVSPHRTARPWQGQRERPQPELRPSFDPNCYLCPGVTRANGAQNPDYPSTYVFTNDFAALYPDTPPANFTAGLLQAHSERGTCRVICFAPRHDLTLAELDQAALQQVITCWIDQSNELGAQAEIAYVQVFENRGAAMGSSNPHPHGQIWANQTIPYLVQTELDQQRVYWQQHQRPLLPDYAATELEQQQRIVVSNADWLIVVPFWAVWPFETLIIPRQQRQFLADLSREEQQSLAGCMQELLIRYDNLFETSFPYSMGWHQAPTDGAAYPYHTLHCHFYPPLLRSESVRKFMVGYEMLAQAQRDITAEAAAARLRDVSAIHWKRH